MRFSIRGSILFAITAASTWSACATSGVSGVYMANDGGGLQHRDVFYTDSDDIFCIAKFSAGNPDSTLDFTILQNGVYPWCGKSSQLTPNTPRVFAVGEQVPGVSVESVVAEEINPEGEMIDINCNGYCTMNGSSGSLCEHSPDLPGSCQPGYVAEEADSCGPGATCCREDDVVAMQMAQPVQQLPYPAGSYTCVVQLDGVEVGSAAFSIVYPGNGPIPEANCPVPPPVTGVPCYDWFPEGSTCPGYVPNTSCLCLDTGSWSCTEK
jgi:hypothetical protein